MAPPTKDNPLGFLSPADRGHETLRRPPLGLFPAQTHRTQFSRAALTPEEALAPSSSSPLQACDVGLTARSQKVVAPSGARSPRTAVETRAQYPDHSSNCSGSAGADPDADSGPGGSDCIPTSYRRCSPRWRRRGVFLKPKSPCVPSAVADCRLRMRPRARRKFPLGGRDRLTPSWRRL